MDLGRLVATPAVPTAASAASARAARPLSAPRPQLPPGREAGSIEEPHGRAPIITGPGSSSDPIQTPSASIRGRSTAPTVAQVPTPPVAVEGPDGEQALSVVVAREVSRQLDSLIYRLPTTMPRDLPFASATSNTPPVVRAPPQTNSDSVTPASTPPPFTHARGPVSGSSHIPRSSLDTSSQTNGPPSPLKASALSLPVQQAQLPPQSIVHARPHPPLLSNIKNSYRTSNTSSIDNSSLRSLP
jgi:hypothetical protein